MKESNIIKKYKSLYLKYGRILPIVLYGIFYLTWFCYLEENTQQHYRLIHMAVDDYIPFCELFVIPYFLWFAYVSAVVLYFLVKDKNDYYRTCVFLFTGMTIFLIVSTLWPNGHHLRPAVIPRDNIFTRMLAFLWRIDTPTNLWPSIHVYNSLGAHFAIMRSKAFENRRWIRYGSLVLCISIILSTLLIKQHSMFDVITALVMAAAMYLIVYRLDLVAAVRTRWQKRKVNPQIIR